MSISTCPRCAEQVTLPMGISTSARVRCPLCRAEYALADALVNMPPILEVIGEHAEELSADWFDEPADARREPRDEAAEAAASSGLHLAAEPPSETKSFADEQSHDDLLFEAGEIEHDDGAMQQQDTEIEDQAFELAPPVDEEAGVFDPVDVGPSEEPDVLDFGEPVASAEIKAEEEDELGIDFAETTPAAEPDAMSDFGADFDSPPASAANDDLGIDFSESEPATASEQGELDFGQPIAAATESEEMSLDFGEPLAAVTPNEDVSAAEPPAGKKKKDKKEKKEKKPKAEKPPADPTKKRSLVGLLLNVVLPAILAVPLALYGALDFTGL